MFFNANFNAFSLDMSKQMMRIDVVYAGRMKYLNCEIIFMDCLILEAMVVGGNGGQET